MDAAPRGPGGTFSGAAVCRNAGSMEFWRYRSSAVAVRRDEARCRRDGADALVIMVMCRGSALLDHIAEARILAHDVFLCDASRPLVGHWNAHEEVHINLPRKLIAARLGRHERHWAGRRFAAGHATGAVLGAYLRSLGAQLDALDDGSLELAGQHIVDLAVRALRAEAVPGGRRPSPHAPDVPRLLECIEAQLADPLLSPAHLAAQLGWSRRKLYRVGEALPDGINGTICSRRLEMIFRDLRDPALRHLRIGDIAGTWCFPDLSHFSRAFRRRFNCSPSALRGG